VPATPTITQVADSRMFPWTIASDGAHVVVMLKDNHDVIHFLVGTELGNR